jgi:hypothetical protein
MKEPDKRELGRKARQKVQWQLRQYFLDLEHRLETEKDAFMERIARLLNTY